MPDKQRPGIDAEKGEEARHVAEDAIEAARQGDAAEARFLAGEAKSLDKQAADAVLANSELGKKGGKS